MKVGVILDTLTFIYILSRAQYPAFLMLQRPYGDQIITDVNQLFCVNQSELNATL